MKRLRKRRRRREVRDDAALRRRGLCCPPGEQHCAVTLYQCVRSFRDLSSPTSRTCCFQVLLSSSFLSSCVSYGRHMNMKSSVLFCS